MKTARQPIAGEWESFARAVLPDDVSDVQRDETRKAFYAGVWSLFHLMLTQLEDGHEVTEADLTLMDDIDQELKSYLAELQAQITVGRS